MSKSDAIAVEHDFFAVENHSSKPPVKRFERGRSFKDIQHAITKINPEVIRNVIASVSADQRASSALPVHTPSSKTAAGSSAAKSGGETAPLTIFFDGNVSVFEVRRLEAEKIMRIAQDCVSKAADSADSNSSDWNADLPLQRTKSLQRFLEKRKSRLVAASPYALASPSSK